MLNDIYSRRILELAADIPLLGTLPDADASAKAHSKLCGSTVTVHLKLDGNAVRAFAHGVKACALGSSTHSPRRMRPGTATSSTVSSASCGKVDPVFRQNDALF